MTSQMIGCDGVSGPIMQEAKRKHVKVKETFPYIFNVQTANGKFVFATIGDDPDKLQRILFTGANVRALAIPGIATVLNGCSPDYKITQVIFTQTGMMELGICMNTVLESRPKWFVEVNLLQQKDDFLLSFREMLPDRPPSYKGFCKMKAKDKELVIGDWMRGRDNRITRVEYDEGGIEGATLQIYPATVSLIFENI